MKRIFDIIDFESDDKNFTMEFKKASKEDENDDNRPVHGTCLPFNRIMKFREYPVG